MMNPNQHPIESLMKTAMENIKEMIEVNTIVGDAIETSEGTVIMPITKVSFGFAAGGAEYGKTNKADKEENDSCNLSERYPFGGGSGAGVSVQPVAFMVMEKDNVQIMHIHHHFGTMSKVLEEAPNLIGKLEGYLNSKSKSKNKNKSGDEPKEKSGKIITKVVEFDES